MSTCKHSEVLSTDSIIDYVFSKKAKSFKNQSYPLNS